MKMLLAAVAIAIAGALALVASIVAANQSTSASNTPVATTADSDMSGMTEAAGATVKGISYAGTTVDNADALAKARTPYPAALPPVPAGDVVKVKMVLKDVTVQIAPGIKYAAWGFQGGVPGPIVHVRQGQTVEMTLTNGGAIPHSIDFHAARIAPNLAFVDVNPGKSFTFRFTANDPGVFMYHCGTKPYSRTLRTACTARSSSTRRRRFGLRPSHMCSSRASGTSTPLARGSQPSWTWAKHARCFPTGRPSTGMRGSTSTTR